MVPVCGKPILWHQVRWLKDIGVTDVVVLAGYRWEVIREHFGEGDGCGFRVHYSVEEAPLGRGGAIKKGLGLVPRDEEYVIATNGDVISAENPGALVERYLASRAANPDHQATIMVVPFTSPYGLVDLDGGDMVTGFREKVQLPHWVNAGVYVMSREIEPSLPEVGDHETTTFPDLACQGRLGAYRSTAFWRSVDSFKDLREAEEYLSGGA